MQNKQIYRHTAVKRKSKRTVAAVLLAIAIVALIGGAWAFKHSKNASTAKINQATAAESGKTSSEFTKGETAKSSTPTTSTNQSKTTTSQSSSSTSTATLIEPTGNFVSSHKVQLSANQNISSTCNTTPGAACNIIFTNGNITKTLGAKTTDAGGAAYWMWNAQSIGLTTGTWKIQAKATLGSQQSTAEDVMGLEVSQ